MHGDDEAFIEGFIDMDDYPKMDNARNVIARGIVDQEYPAGAWNLLASSQPRWLEQADAIIEALNAAGYEIVQRDALLPPPGPSNIIVTQPSPLPAPKRVDDQ